MGQSLVKNYIHIVFSTKHRAPLIQEPFQNELHSYLGGICKNLECHQKNRILKIRKNITKRQHFRTAKTLWAFERAHAK